MILVEDPPSIIQTKVFEMKVCLGIALPTCVDEGRNKFVVLFTSTARLANTKIQIVIEKILVL